MTSLQMAGTFLGPLLSGQLSDRFGRKFVLLGFLVVEVGSAMISALSTSPQMFAVCRFFIGLGLAGTFSVQITWACECFLSKNRMLLYIGGWPLGYVIFSLLVMATREWRALAVVGNLFGVASFLLAIFLPESPKWLLERGKTKLAVESLRKMGRCNGDVASKDAIEGMIAQGFLEDQNWGRTFSYWHLFRNRESTKRILLSMFTYSVGIAVFYGLLFNLGSFAGDPAINTLIVGSLRLVLGTLVPILDRRLPCLGRRKLLQLGIGSWTVCLLGIFTVYALHLEEDFPFFLTACATSALGFSSGSILYWIVAELISVELFPTVLRNMGNALTSSSSRITAIFAPNVLLLGDLWPLAPWIVFLSLLVLDSILNFIFLPETKGKPLPDMDARPQAVEPEFLHGL